MTEERKQLSRRRFLTAAATGVAGVLAASCATPTPQVVEKVVEKPVEKVVEKVVTAAPKAPIKLQWYSLWTGAVPGFDKFEELLGFKFAQAHPEENLQVERLAWPSGGNEAITTGAKAGTLADVLTQQCWDIPWQVDLVPLMDLGPARELLGGDDAWTFSSKWKGKNYMNYAYGGPMLSYYNKTWLSKAGVEFPKNWKEYIDICTKVTDVKNNKYATVVKLKSQQNFHHEFAPWLLQAGGKMVDENNMLAFNSDAGVSALEFMKQIDDAKVALPGTLENDTNPERQGFGAEQVAWEIFEGTWEGWIIGTMKPAFEWDIALTPEGPGGKMSESVGTGFSANGKSKAPSWAAELVMYLTAGDGNLEWQKMWALMPAFKKFIPAVVEKEPKFNTILKQAEIGTTGLPVFDGWSEMNDILAKHEALYWQGKETPKAALDATVDEWKKAISRS